jgi:hypothetical protein
VHVEVSSPDEAAEAYRRLLGDPEAVRSDPERARVALASGELVLHEGGSSGIVGVVLGVPSLEATRAVLGESLGRSERGVAWVDRAEAFGLRLGFTEVGSSG